MNSSHALNCVLPPLNACASLYSQVSNERTTVWGLLTERQVRLDLCLQLRLFEADVHASMERLRRGVPAIAAAAAAAAAAANSSANSDTASIASTATTAATSPAAVGDLFWVADPRQAPSIEALEDVNGSCTAVLPTVEEVLNKGGELIRAFESVGVNFPAGTW